MKKFVKWMVSVLVLVSAVVVYAAPREQVDLNEWSIKGVQVTATAADLNSGVASSTASLVSNATLKVYGRELVITNTASIKSLTISDTAPTPGAVLAATVTNLPTGSTTNAVFIKFWRGGTAYVVPAYAQP